MEFKIHFGKMEKINSKLLMLVDENHLLKSSFNQFENTYGELLKFNMSSLKIPNCFVDGLKHIKRNPINTGPYQELSIYENANRILSDQIVLKAVNYVLNFKNEKDYTLEINLGNSGFFDSDIVGRRGDEKLFLIECFNVVNINDNQKTKKTIDKMNHIDENCEKYIGFNKCAKGYQPKYWSIVNQPDNEIIILEKDKFKS